MWIGGRLAKALASSDPPARRVRSVLSALQSYPTLPHTERVAHLTALAVELASSNEVPLIRTFLDQAGAELDGETLSNERTLPTQTVGAADTALTVTNTRSSIAPTGLLLDAAPYGAMLALAAGSGLVFFRKRRRED